MNRIESAILDGDPVVDFNLYDADLPTDFDSGDVDIAMEWCRGRGLTCVDYNGTCDRIFSAYVYNSMIDVHHTVRQGWIVLLATASPN